MRPEKKFYDFSLAVADLTQNGVFAVKTGGVTADSTTLVDIAQGVTENQRIGRKCTITNIYLRMNFQFDFDANADILTARLAREVVRVIVYWDKQCNGAAATAAQLLEGATPTYNAFRNLANKKRFVFLYDKMFTWSTTVIAVGLNASVQSEILQKDYTVKISKKVFMPIEFESTTGAITEIRSNNIGMIFFTKYGARMSVVVSQCRIRFTDY